MLNAEAYGVWTPFERKTCTINFSMNDMMFQMLTWLFCYFLHVRMSVLYIFCTVKFSRLMFQVSTWLFSSLSICLSCKFSVPVNFSRLKRYEKNFYTHGFQKIHIHGLGLRKYRQLESRIIPGRYYVKRNMKWIRPSSWKLIYYVKRTGFFFLLRLTTKFISWIYLPICFFRPLSVLKLKCSISLWPNVIQFTTCIIHLPTNHLPNNNTPL